MMVSVIIPCYNSESFLSRAVESVLKQGYDGWELILVNNNSEDDTQAVIDHYVHRYPYKVKSLFEGKKGACYARNNGVRASKGTWIQFLDADDEMLPGKWQRQLDLASDSADIVIGSFTRIYLNAAQEEDFIMNPQMNIWHAILRSQAGITSANLYRRSAVVAVSGWNEALDSSQEYDLLFRLLKAGARACYDTKLSARVYEESNSVSRPKDKNGRERIINNYVELRIRIAAHLNEYGIWDSDLRRIYARSLYEMMLNRKGASILDVHTVMKELGLETTDPLQLLQRAKYYTKKLIFRNKVDTY
ncbi:MULTISPECIES: glycosyltransferase family 2 protein [Olivibacter]|uniref:Glycosyltransferase family 2 protein n=1 Tax=Olivibacter jilunii TaxID=985016 RepID=A0ABW6B7T3_9SPHI|nr:glycosyltransferase family 2 protein [Olivibacter sp. UJ_SKK_5.1]MDX3912862.1 glycosyltransferase family A protein [Pseudosphingobacterium sp.]